MSERIQSETHPEYIEQNIILGAAKITILRPELTTDEKAHHKEQIEQAALQLIMATEKYQQRKERAKWART